MKRDKILLSLSSAPHGKLIDFECAEIRSSQFNDELYLYVSGVKPKDGWQAILSPRIHHAAPDYADIEVLKVRNRHNNEDNDSESYQLSIPVTSITGLKGIQIIAANGEKLIEI